MAGRKYKRKFGRKKRTRWSIYGAAGKQLVKDVKSLKNLINTEWKDCEVGTSATPTTTGSLILLNGLTKGDDYNNRDGRSARFKSIQLSLATVLNGSASTTRIRWALVIDRDASNTVNSAAIYSNEYASFRNLDNRRRFTFLKEGHYTSGIYNGAPSTKIVDYYRKIDMHTIYDDSNNGDITDIRTNALYLYLWSDQATNTPTVGITTRLRFIDN